MNGIGENMDSSGFVLLSDIVPDVILEMRYYSTYNFIGRRIDGYDESVALLTRQAAQAVKLASDAFMAMGYRLKVYDAYRPQMAVDYFMRWAQDERDDAMRQYFYPTLQKGELIPGGYIATRSGHSRGSTVDVTLLNMATGKELDMGGLFDWFGPESHPGYTNLTKEQLHNRQLLSSVMIKHGFKGIDSEWWHFTLADEPYPDTYFAFPVRRDAIN